MPDESKTPADHWWTAREKLIKQDQLPAHSTEKPLAEKHVKPWWDSRTRRTRRKPRRPRKPHAVCPGCHESDKLSIHERQSSTGKTLYLLGCERCNETIRYVLPVEAMEIENGDN